MMNLSLCTISFRHHLISLDEIAEWASQRGFQGIELWGVHAKNLSGRAEYDADWLGSYRLSVPMLSDYLPLEGERSLTLGKANELCHLAHRWGAPKLRTFAGGKPSKAVSASERGAWVARMQALCEVVARHGLLLVVETHPNTLADTQESTLQLIEEVNHPALRLNFDVIHMWEAGADPVGAFRALLPAIAHVHLKNIAAREYLHVFSPANVYAPAGDRSGMVNLFQGACDFRSFFRSLITDSALPWESLDASLEWFGSDVLVTLEQQHRQLLQFEAELTAHTGCGVERAAPLA